MRLWLIACSVVVLLAAKAPAAEPPDEVAAAQQIIDQADRQRIETLASIAPTVVAVMDPRGEGGGSGVLISPDGFAITNFHVVAPCGPGMLCGLPDGKVYDGVLVGLDPTGDIALIKLLGRNDFPYAELGDSDQVRPGDPALVLGNPMMLADDFRPSVSCGLISGVGRYQYPDEEILEYADCLQTDAAINPGNSGGPLFNAAGQVIGINGRASFGERGRVNVGVGYAVSINQVRRFLPQLRAGRIVDHASLGVSAVTLARAALIDRVDRGTGPASQMLQVGDRVVTFEGRPITSANALKNAIGGYPVGWPVRVGMLRAGKPQTIERRLGPLHAEAKLLGSVTGLMQESPIELAEGAPYAARPGLANDHFNHAQLEQLLGPLHARAQELKAPWVAEGTDQQGGRLELRLEADRSSLETQAGRFWLDGAEPLSGQDSPPGSGGLLAALHLLRLVVSQGSVDRIVAFGETPLAAGAAPLPCLQVEHGGASGLVFFDGDPLQPVAIELQLSQASPPCRLRWGAVAEAGGQPRVVKIVVDRADGTEATLRLIQIAPNFLAAPTPQAAE